MRWTPQRRKAARLLAEGRSTTEVAEELGVVPTTIRSWMKNREFMAYLDELTLSSGVALKAERLRIAKEIIRRKLEGIGSRKDLLDWLKYVQSEMDEKEAVGQTINLQIVTEFTNLKPEERPAAFLNVSRALWRNAVGLQPASGTETDVGNLIKPPGDVINLEDSETV